MGGGIVSFWSGKHPIEKFQNEDGHLIEMEQAKGTNKVLIR